MIVKTTVEFTAEDKELLSKELPKNPCDSCGVDAACCGCPSGDAYNSAVRPYKENSIYEIALKLKEIKTRQKSIKILQGQIEDLKSEIPAELLDITDKMDLF